MRNLANKIKEFSKCDDFSGEISSAHRNTDIGPVLNYLEMIITEQDRSFFSKYLLKSRMVSPVILSYKATGDQV
jgi:hypothetical protein